MVVMVVDISDVRRVIKSFMVDFYSGVWWFGNDLN